MALKKRERPGGGSRGEASVGASPCGWEELPALAEFMVSVSYEGGSPRRLPTLLIFTEDRLWKACLNDRDATMVAFVTAATFDALLGAIDAGLQNDSLEWRTPRPARR